MKLLDLINEAVKLSQEEIEKRLAIAKELAPKYKNTRQFALDHKTLWGFLRLYKLVDEVFPKRQKYNEYGHWTPETVGIEASKYNSKSDFEKGSQVAYKKALKLGILDDLFPLPVQRKEYTKKYDLKKSIELAKDFDGTRSDFMARYAVAYRFLKDNNLVDKYLGPSRQGSPKHNDDELIARAQEYSSQIDLRQKDFKLYNILNSRGLIDAAFDRNKVWEDRKNEKIAAAKKYETLNDLRKNDVSLYHYLKRNELLQDVFGDNLKFGSAIRKAKQYKNKQELFQNKRYLYKKLMDAGLLDDIFPKTDLSEGRSRTELGSGVDHIVFNATDDSNIVYKIGPKLAIDGWFEDFKKNPDIFPKVYKRGRTTMKLKSEKNIITNKGWKKLPVGTILPLEYVKLEKLNTERVEKEWDALDRMFEDIMEIDDWGFLDFLITHMTNTPKAKANGYDNDKMLNHITTQVKKLYPGLYKIFLNYINLTDKIMSIRSGVPDLHKYNFGYDSKGKLKCLDL